MQPLHSREARWFWEWSALEIARGFGISIALVSLLFLFLHGNLIGHCFPRDILSWGFIFGVLLAVCSYFIDCQKGPTELRALACRKCRARATIGKMQEAGWKCRKCGTVGLFDEL